VIGQIAPLAVLAAIAPATVTAVLLILTGSRPIRRLAALYSGGLVTSVGIGYAIVAGFEGSGAFSGSGSRHVSPGIDLAAGSVALLLAGWLAPGRAARRKQRRAARKSEGPRRDPWSQRMVDRGSSPLMFVIGMILNLPSGLYLIALKDVAAKHPSNAAALAALVAFNLVMLTPIELPMVASLADPEGTLKRMRSLSAWLADHGRQLVTAVALVAGVYLVVRGAAGL
jgi:Sap-like sulfolipid-1-addressing protein